MRIIKSDKNMRSKVSGSFVLAAFVMVACLIPGVAHSQAAPAAPQDPMAFDTPQQAADAVVKAAGDYDVAQLMAIFGPDGKDFVSGGDAVQAKNSAIEFARDAQAKMSISMEASKSPMPVNVVGQATPKTTTATVPPQDRAVIIVGEKEWPFPVPLTRKKDGKWYFDSKTGRQQILFRRIGANELDAITVCRGYVEAQKEYAEAIHDNSGVNQYAQKIFSTPGKQDGLYWKNADGTSAGPIGDTVAKALDEGYTSGKDGFHGYYFKILKGQGANAPGGAINYVIKNIMIGGFALVAVPAEYRVTGVKTFLVSYEGTVYQKDLGPNSLEIVKQMQLYNPDKTWQATEDEWPAGSSEQASSE
jgi:hypothetical protein